MKAEGHYSAAYLLVALRGYLLSSFASLDELQCIERAVRPSLPEDGHLSWRPKSDARFNARSSTLAAPSRQLLIGDLSCGEFRCSR